MLKRLGFNTVVGIDPSESAVNIARSNDIAGINYIVSGGENIPCRDNQFDYVHCYTVLEHVESPANVISEAYRILKSGGKAYFGLPDYNHIFEGHYKVFLPLFLGKALSSLFLKMYGRPSGS